MAMTPRRCKAVLTTGCTALVVLLAGCTSSAATRSSQPPPAQEPAHEAQAAVGPLEAFLGFKVDYRPEGLETAVPALNPDSAGPSEEDRRDQLRLEQMIGDCMRSEGFEYVVRDPFAATGTNPKNSPYALSPEEFAAQYGYGISTIDVPTATDVDANSAALAEMKPAERQAYLWALDGGAEQGDTENTGCQGRAVQAVFGRSTAGAAPAGAAGAFAALVEEIRTLNGRVDNDPRVAVDAARRWADCMADAGHPGLTRPSDAADSVRIRLAQARANPAVMAEVRTYEVTLARADSVCRTDYDATRRQVSDELEGRFLTDNGNELGRYRDAMNPDGAGR